MLTERLGIAASCVNVPVNVPYLVILAIGLGSCLAQAEDFICPTCSLSGPNAEKDCENYLSQPDLSHPVCECKDQPQCIVYKNKHFGLFTRICASESIYQEELQKCNADPGCQMGRCFTSGCFATLGEN
ncbi:hypothetical protein ACROYT_G044534 [Oculina patagonica]